MAGKTTYLHGPHPGSIGCIVEPVKIGNEQLEQISTAVSRDLTAAEIVDIEDWLGLFRSLRDEHNNDPVTSQDTKRTLTAIGKLSGEKAKAAYTDLDSKSEPLILKALYYLGARGETILDPPGDLISKAALYALDSLPSAMSGAPTKDYQRRLADYVFNCWQSLGGESCKAWADDDKVTPLVRFGVILFSIVEGKGFDKSKVATLIRENPKYQNPD